jgi:hypothetical protein
MIVYICTQHNLGWRKYRGENKNQIAAIEDWNLQKTCQYKVEILLTGKPKQVKVL